MSGLNNFYLEINRSNITTYAGAVNNAHLQPDGITSSDTAYAINFDGESGDKPYVDLNNNAINLLFPNAVAKAQKLTISAKHRRTGVFSGKAQVGLNTKTTDSNMWLSAQCTSNSNDIESNTGEIDISSYNLTSPIGLRLTGYATAYHALLRWIKITLSFIYYEFSAITGTDISSTTVNSSSTATGYDGDNIIYNATTIPGYSFIGWYKNNILYSTQQNNLSYTVNGEDVTLEARAVPNEIYINYNNSVINKQRVVTSIPLVYNGVTKYTMTQGTKKNTSL